MRFANNLCFFKINFKLNFKVQLLFMSKKERQRAVSTLQQIPMSKIENNNGFNYK